MRLTSSAFVLFFVWVWCWGVVVVCGSDVVVWVIGWICVGGVGVFLAVWNFCCVLVWGGMCLCLMCEVWVGFILACNDFEILDGVSSDFFCLIGNLVFSPKF